MLNFEELDHEFMTEGNPDAEAEKMAGLIEQNLTPEEQARLKEMMPILEEYNMLMVKVQTGNTVEELDNLGALEALGVPSREELGTDTPQEGQMQREAPSRPAQREVPQNAPEMPQNAPEMMSQGGKVDISGILTGPKPDWLKRALDPATSMTKDNESIRGMTGSMDGRQILVPTIRMVDGELVRYEPEEAFKIAREKEDYLVLPAKSDKEAEAYSKELSDEFGRRRFEFEKVTQGMAVGGVVPAGPAGVVNQPGADNSGVGDDVPVKSDGFVINAAAVRKIGLRKVNDIIQKAIKYAQEQGMQLDLSKTPVNAEEILVSNGEVVIPDVLARIIGYDELEEINALGAEETEENIEEQGEEPMKEMPLALNRGGLTGQEQYVGDMQEKIKLLDEEATDTDPYTETIHIDQFPAESSDEKIYEYPKETVKSAIAQHEWRGQKPRHAFVGLTKGMKSSAYGPGQIVGDTMQDMINRNIFGNGKLKNYAEKISAAQTLFTNYWVNKMGIRGTDTDLGKSALKKLGIDREQFQKYVDEGYFTPSNNPDAQERGIPRELLGKNSDRNYDFLWDAVIKEKTKRSSASEINTFLMEYHGGNEKDNNRYAKGITDILDQKD